MKINYRRILTIILTIIIFTSSVSLVPLTIKYAKDRIIKSNENITLPNEKIEEETFTEDIPVEETNTEATNSYEPIELAIVITSSTIATITLFYVIITKASKYKISEALNTNTKAIYASFALVALGSIVPVLTIVKSDEIVLNGYDTRTIDKLSMAVIEVTSNLKNSNLNETSTDDNTSVILVSNGASYKGDKINITKKDGDTTDTTGSKYFGLNSAFVLNGGTTTLTNSNITSNVTNSSAFFATGEESEATLDNVTLITNKDYSNAIGASDASTIEGTKLNIKTTGNQSSAIESLDKKSTIIINDSTINTLGINSPLFYSYGKIEGTNIKGSATTSPIAVIEGRNDLSLTNSYINTNGNNYEQNKIGAAFYIYGKDSLAASQDFASSNLTLIDSEITINKDSKNYNKTPIFYLTNTDANINVTNTKFNYGSNILLKAVKNKEYGDKDANGAKVTFTATDEYLKGNIIVDKYSSLSLNFNNTTYKGAINHDNESTDVNVVFDRDSKWILTSDSYINTLTVTKKDLNNFRKYIRSNGHNIYYNKENNEWLHGRTYSLIGGGRLIPMKEAK